jgi:hypothetical protein
VEDPPPAPLPHSVASALEGSLDRTRAEGLCLKKRFPQRNYSIAFLTGVSGVVSALSVKLPFQTRLWGDANFVPAGPQFVFNMGGGPGLRVHQFGGPRPRRRPREANGQSEPAPSGWASLQQLLPILLLFILPLLSSLFSSTTSTSSGPYFRFETPVPPYTMQRTTPRLKINYFVNPVDVEDFSTRKFNQLDQRAEVDYVTRLRYDCDSEAQIRDRMVQEAQGWFFPDAEKLKEARSMELKSCRRLNALNGKLHN